MSSPPPAAPSARRQRWRGWIGLARGRPFGSALLLVLVAVLLLDEGPVQRGVRQATLDLYQHMFPRKNASGGVVLVAIDDLSLVAMGQWPWPRSALADIIERIAAQKPAALVVDELFPEPDRLSPRLLARQLFGLGLDETLAPLDQLPDNDGRLAAALRQVPAVLGVAPLTQNPGVSAWNGYRQAVLQTRGNSAAEASAFVPNYPAALHSIDVLDQAASGHGALSRLTEPDGIVRRMPSLVAIGGQEPGAPPVLLPSLAVEALRVVGGDPLLRVRLDRSGVRQVGVAGLDIPTDRDGGWWIHFSRPPSDRDAAHDGGSGREYFPAFRVAQGRMPDDAFTDRIVVLGFIALGLQDTITTPLGPSQGVYAHIEAIENVLDHLRSGKPLLSRPYWARWAEAALLLALATVLVVAVPSLRPTGSAAVFLGSSLLVFGLGVLAFLTRGWLIDWLNPLRHALLVFAFMLAVTLSEANLQRRSLREALVTSREAQARLEGELDAARRIQMGMLPVAHTELGAERRVQVAGLMRPARTVGGDLYDFFKLDDSRLFFLVGDVSGKGLPASLFMALAKALIKGAALRTGADPGRALCEAGLAIARDNPELLFVTVLAGVIELDSGRLAWCSAGHEAPYLLREGPPQQLSGAGGPPLCVIDDFAYRSESLQLASGDTLCIVSDGVTEAENPDGVLYGRTRLAARLAGLPPAPAPAAVVEAVQQDVAAFAGGQEQSDDLTILVLRYVGAPVMSPPLRDR